MKIYNRLSLTDFYQIKKHFHGSVFLCFKSTGIRHSELVSESHHIDYQSLWEPEIVDSRTPLKTIKKKTVSKQVQVDENSPMLGERTLVLFEPYSRSHEPEARQLFLWPKKS